MHREHLQLYKEFEEFRKASNAPPEMPDIGNYKEALA
jgi:hypothetical protein